MFPKPDASVDNIAHTVATTSDTITIAYPAGRKADSYGENGNHRITGRDFSELLSQMGHLSITFGPSDITIINNTDRQFKEGTVANIELDVAGWDIDSDQAAPGVTEVKIVEIALGAPIASDSDAAVASQAATAADGLATGINGVLAADGVATFDVPRNVVAAWTGAAVLTVTGTDAYGETIVESSGSGTSLTGKKAFKTITDISVSADVTGLTVGNGKVLGLPVFMGSDAALIAEREDGAAPTAGALVAGVEAVATATTGDVRGTYAPSGAPNGAKDLVLVAMLRSSAYLGVDQFAG
jgi:hypothetical protein